MTDMKDRFDDIDDVGIDWWQLAMVVMFILMAAGILASCKTKYVTVPEYHKEYIVRSDTVARVDSVLLHDSVFVYNVGDTIVINKVMYRDRVKNVYKTRTDTILKRDSIPYKVEVEKQLTKDEISDLALGNALRRAKWWFALALVLAVAYEGAKCWLKKKLGK